MRIARLGILAYLGYLTVLFSLQTRLIFPGHETQGQEFARSDRGQGPNWSTSRPGKVSRSSPCSGRL